MGSYRFFARALSRDIDLNRLAKALGIEARYRWEEPVVLAPATLERFDGARTDAPRVDVYAFGSAVFVNCADDEVAAALARLRTAVPGLSSELDETFVDDYALRTGAREFAVTNEAASVPGDGPRIVDTVSLVLAKSVSLDRIESRLDRVFDEIEPLIDSLRGGNLAYPDTQMARLAALILDLKYRSLSHVMVLDKPEYTWENVESEQLYLGLANEFELVQRYREIQHKSETLLDVMQVFASLSHARRATRLEVIIIVLILIEVVIYVVEFVTR